MSDLGQSGLSDSADRCGNCGSAVSATDIVCPACGVLLAAYQAPAGATAGTSAATRPVPSPPSSDPAVSPSPGPWLESGTASHPATPRSQSPIGDALNRARQAGTTIGTTSGQLASADTADELARMASTDSEVSRQIDAQLSGAKVRFDGAMSTITPDPDAARAPCTPAAVPAQPAADSRGNAPQPVATARTTAHPAHPTHPTHPTGQRAGQAAAIERIRLAREDQRVRDAAAVTTPGAPVGTTEPLRNRASWREGDLGKIMSVAPFILILIFILLGFSRVMALFGIVFAIGAGLLLLIVLLRLTTHTGRKTGDMPRENPFDQLQ